MDEHYDLVILGGGCAGLSLAMRLADAGPSAPSTLILEKNANYLNDKTWCFWDEGNPELKSWVDHSWFNFKIKNGVNSFIKCCKGTPYLMISAESFYQHAIAKMASNKQLITLLKDQEIFEVAKKENQIWTITTNRGTYTADKIVDTRPSNNISDQKSILWQSFIGYEVESELDLFNAKTFILMDFDATFKQGLGFIYLLPFSEKRALIEYTVFSQKAISAESLKDYIKPGLLNYLKNDDYKTLRIEYGKLPMGNQKIKRSNDLSYIYAGLFAGAARPSSGYAFQRIQKWAKACSHELITNKTLIAPEMDSTILASMDEIFLNVLKSNPKSSITLFFNFFSNCKTIRVIRFLSDHANSRDYLSIIMSMPKLFFLKELPAYTIKKIVRLFNE